MKWLIIPRCVKALHLLSGKAGTLLVMAMYYDSAYNKSLKQLDALTPTRSILIPENKEVIGGQIWLHN